MSAIKEAMVDIASTQELEECEQCGSLDKLTGFDLIEHRCPQTGYITGGRIHLCRRCLRHEGQES